MYVARGRVASGFAKDQSFKGPRAAPSIAGRIHASLEREDHLFGAQRLGLCFLSTERQAAAGSEYARRRLSAPAAARAGILSSHRDDCGRLVEDDPRRFGFHNLRHSLASFLVRIRTDPKTVQTLLRHSDVKLTLQFYSHAVSQDRMVATGEMLIAILSHAADQSGLGAD
jgi:integrase